LQYKFEQKEAELKAHQERRELMYIIAVLVLSVVIITISFLYIAGRNKQNRITLQKKNLELEKNNLTLEHENLKQDLIIKNKELTTNVLNLVQKNEIIKTITDKLLSVKSNLKPENKDVINQVIIELQTSTDNDMWQEFELHFQQVHADFYDKLKNRFPDLTPNEIKLCAFLRLNMNTKDICAITKQSLRSIEVARSRLRKKLEITNTDVNLVTFLAQL